ncbi:unnamed protein product, partial [Tenebrio molitor]
LDPDDISIDSLKVLWYGGFHPVLNPVWTSFLLFVNVSLWSLLLVLALIGVLTSYKTDLFFTAECLQTCILTVHVIGKFSVLHFRKNTILNLLNKKSQFWKIGEFDGQVYIDSSKVSHFIKKMIRYYYCLIFSVCLFFDLQPFSTGRLPTVCYVPQGWFKFLTVAIWYLSYTVGLNVAGTDGLFCSLGISLIVQFKLLSHKFKTVKFFENECETKLWSELKNLVDYHNFLLSYCKELNRAFRDVFFVQFFISIASASVSVFIFMQPGNWTNRIKFLLYFVAEMMETAFYCVPLEFVVNAAHEVGKAVYESEWYKTRTIGVRKCLTVVLARTQKAMIFSGYGLIDINLRTYLQICKTVFTFYTYLNSAKKL